MDKTSIQNIKEKIIPILKSEGVTRSVIFGSFARGEENSASDVDILVAMPKGKSLFDLANLKLLLDDCLGRNVDIVTFQSIHPLLKKNIECEQISVL